MAFGKWKLQAGKNWFLMCLGLPRVEQRLEGVLALGLLHTLSYILC